jgi:hypothetical protein
MRILLTNHFPIEDSAAGALVVRLAQGFVDRGHAVRLLVVDHNQGGASKFYVRTIVCNPTGEAADLRFALPRFAAEGDRQLTFHDLSNRQLNDYRQALRDAFDDEISTFDPHIIHVQHIWLQGHLALEAGVPYVLSAWGPELEDASREARFRRYAQETAENAGCILTASDDQAAAVRALFGDLEDRVVTIAPDDCDQTLLAYRQVLQSRFGDTWRP